MSALDAGLGWNVAGVLIAASLATSFITAAFGIGGGVVLLAILASFIPPAALIPVHGLVQLGSNFGRVAIMFSHINWSLFIPFTAGSVIGVALGGSIAVNLPPSILKIGLGLFILWAVLGKPPASMRGSAVIAGAFSSFLTMFFGGTGSFVSAFVKSTGVDRFVLVATHSTLMTMQHFLKTVAFGFLGFAFGQWMPLITAMIVAGFIGTVIGRQVLVRIDEDRFQIILSAILVLLALRLVWTGGYELLI